MIEKNTSTRFSHDPDVGVKCSVIRGCFGEPLVDLVVLVGVVVVKHDVQLAAWVTRATRLRKSRNSALP